MMLYGVTLGQRFTGRQKALFGHEISRYYGEQGFPVRFQEEKPNVSGGNILAGDLQDAHTVFAAAYDTPAKALLPGFVYYPFHTRKNLKQERRNLALQLVLGGILALGAYISLQEFLKQPASQKLIFCLIAVLFGAGILRVWGTKGNEVNFNRNSASLAVMAKLAKDCGGNKEAAFVFLDRGISSFDGFRKLEKACLEPDKTLLVLDSIAYGEKLVLAHREEGREQAVLFTQLAEKRGLAIVNKEYDKEKAGENMLAFAGNILYLVSGSVKEKEFIVRDTRSKKDIQVDIKRLEILVQVCMDFLSEGKVKRSQV